MGRGRSMKQYVSVLRTADLLKSGRIVLHSTSKLPILGLKKSRDKTPQQWLVTFILFLEDAGCCWNLQHMMVDRHSYGPWS